MRLSFIVIITIFSLPSFGQIKIFDIKADTSFWYSLKKIDAKRIGLDDLTTSTDNLHFRFWIENQSIDIWSKDNKTYSGLIANHTESISNNVLASKISETKFYSNKILIDTSIAIKIYELFKNSRIFNIPSDKNIKGWNQGFDGEEILFESSTKDEYSFKQYWTPSVFKNLQEATVLNKLIQQLKKELNLKFSWKEFIQKLPKGCYRSGELTMMCTDIKSKRKNKPKD